MHLAPPTPRGAAARAACAVLLVALAATAASAQVRVFPTSGSGVLAGDVTAIGGIYGGYGVTLVSEQEWIEPCAVAGPGGALGSVRCWRGASGGVTCDMDGGVLAVGPPMCAAP